MAKSQDGAAKRIAKQCSGRYDPTRSPDVRCKKRVVEVKSTSGEIPTALGQLKGSRLPKYVALPAKEHKKARAILKGTGVGLIDYNGRIAKRARRRG